MSTKTRKSAKKSTKATKTKAEDTKAKATEEGTSRQVEGAPACPSCGAPMVLRSGKYGSFYGCSRFNSGECTATVAVQQ